MEKRLALSAAGIRELELLRDKHQVEMDHLMRRLSSTNIDQGIMAEVDGNSSTSSISLPPEDVPPPLPPRQRLACYSLSDMDYPKDVSLQDNRRSSMPTGTLLDQNAANNHQQTLERSSTFRRPRKMSESTVFNYPSPMHAILMQYPNSDTQQVTGKDTSNTPEISCNEGGYLETTFPADGEDPICSHCNECGQQACRTHLDSDTHDTCERNIHDTPPESKPPSGCKLRPQHSRISHPKARRSRNMSNLSEEGYFSSSERSFDVLTRDNNVQEPSTVESSLSLFSNDSCLVEESCTDQDQRWFVVSKNGKPKIYCFNDEVEQESQVFV